jgi:hypothetical protein
MKKLILAFLISFLFFGVDVLLSQSSSSLHMTRKGKEYFYNLANAGFQTITNIPMSSLKCMRCHPGKLANGTPVDTATYQPSCNDCHNFNIGSAVPDSICMRCHSRQKVEIANYTDVHRSGGLKCTGCHVKEELHMDASNMNTMFDTTSGKTCGTIGCHNNVPVTPDDSLAHIVHVGKLECASCHARAEVTCYNCHFETEVWQGMKGFKRPIGQLRGFIMLGRLPKHGNRIGLVNYQSLVYQGQSFVGYGPYYAHTIMRKDSTRQCGDCHNNAIINELNTTGKIYVAKWDSTLTPKRIVHKTGVIPIPPNYLNTYIFDFANYIGRVDTTYTDPTKWVFMKTGTDGQQMLSQYVLPLTAQQMTTLGAVIGVNPIGTEIPNEFDVMQNFPNPFNPVTKIRFKLPSASDVILKVYNSMGIEVRSILDGKRLDAGLYEAEFSGADLPSGAYFYRLSASGYSKTLKMMLIK